MNPTIPPEPIWHEDPDEWARTADIWASVTGPTPLPEASDHGIAVATMVLYTAADYNTLYSRPIPLLVRTWANMFDTVAPWLTIQTAESAVRAHFATCTDGDIGPGHVIAEARKITTAGGPK